MNDFPSNNFIIAGGGTGGHVFPAISLAYAIKEVNPDINIHFVGTKKGLESKVLKEHNWPLHFVSIGKFKDVSLIQKIQTIFYLFYACYQSVKLIIQLKPIGMLGVGGYASFPILFIGSFFNIDTAIWEPNAHPGLTNRILSKFIKKAFVVFPQAKKHLKTRVIIDCGIPIRKNLENFIQNTDMQKNKSSKDKINILFFGGSQGAKALNDTLIRAIENAIQNPLDNSWINKINLVHQTGELHFNQIKKRYDKTNLNNIEVFPFLYEIEKYYQWADIIFCRSGASTLAEIIACNKASVLIPLTTASDNHQQKNAESIAEEKAAIMILQKNFQPNTIKKMLEYFINNPHEISILEEKIKKFQQKNAALKIAQVLIKSNY